MSATLEMDPDRLRLLADRLVRDAETLAKIGHELASIPPGTGVESATGRAIDIASDAAAVAAITAILTRRVVGDAVAADTMNTLGLGVGSWWAIMFLAAFGPSWTPGNGIVPTPDDDPATTRERLIAFLNEHGPDSWNDLPQETRDHLIATCPDLVVLLVHGRGGTLSAADREALSEVAAYDERTDTYYVEGDGRVHLKVDVVVAGGFELTVIERSDGKVTITYSDGADVGAGVSATGKGSSGTADVTVGGNRLITYEFESKKESDAAIEELKRAAAGAAGEMIRTPEGWEWAALVNPLAPIMVAGTRAARALTADTVEETLDKWGDHIDRVEVGVEIARAVSGSTSLPGLADLSGTAGSTMEVSYSNEVGGDDDYLSASWSGDVGGSAAAALATVAGDTGFKLSGDAQATAAVEYRMGTDGQNRLIVTLDGQVTGGLDRGAELSDPRPNQTSSGTFEHNQADGRAASLTIEIPVDGDTMGAANDVVEAIASGHDPSDALATLYDEADITVSTSNVETESYDLSVDGVGSVSAGHDTETTTEVYRKRPYGDWYSETDLMDQLDD